MADETTPEETEVETVEEELEVVAHSEDEELPCGCFGINAAE